MIGFGLVVARLLQDAATVTLFGASLFSLYAYAGLEPADWQRFRMQLLLWSTIVAMLSGLLWFAFSVANMSGSLSDLGDAEVVWAVVRDTSFGIVWMQRMALVGVLIFLIAARRFFAAVSWNFTTSILAALLLGSLAGVGHAQAEGGGMRLLHVASDVGHLLAAGAWLGGLLPLACILNRSRGTRDDATLIENVLLRFSGVGYVAVATLVSTGLVNSWFLVGSVSNLLRTTYGQVLLIKLLLFAGMLALAVANRFWLVPSLRNVKSVASDDKPAEQLRRLFNHVLGEQLLGAMVLFVVSILGTLQPATVQ